MRRLFLLIILLTVILSGCDNSNTNIINSQDEVSVVLPDDETAATVNGYFIPPNEDEIRYYGNIISKKFHEKDCVWVSKTDKINLKEFVDRNEPIKEGYIPCKICKP